jgi:hypothetical protein
MANTVQIKRGNNTSVNAHTGPSGEIIYNLDTGRLHAQDGSTAGGKPHALISDVDLKANAATQVIAGDGLTGGGTLAASRTLALNSTSIASLAKADTAVQSVNGKSGSAVALVKGDIGLGNVDNTSDASKPISTATQTALNAKANSSVTVSAGTGLTGGGNLTANRSLALTPAAIASLAKADSAIQAPGGTTGQILAKNSNTTNDVGWVSSEAATAVSYGPQTLTEAQQGQARANIGAGILSGFRNKIINGAFSIWQRGPSFPAGTATRYTADRWRVLSAGTTLAVAAQALEPGTIPGSDGEFARITVASVSGAGNYGIFQQPTEDAREFAGKKATVTFYARANAPRSIGIEVERFLGVGGTNENGIGATKVDIGTTWARYDVVIDVPSMVGRTFGTGSPTLSLTMWLDAGSNFNARSSGIGHQSGTFDIAHVSMVEGDATAEEDPFSPRHIQQELALCQRYYEIVTGGVCTNTTASTTYRTQVSPSVIKREAPSVVWLGAVSVNHFPGASPTVVGVNDWGSISMTMVASTTGNGGWSYHSFALDAEI